MAKSPLPPQDLEAEQYTLGSLLDIAGNGRADFDAVRSVLSADMFFALPAGRHLYQAVLDAADAGEPVEGPALLPRLKHADPGTDWQQVVKELGASDPPNVGYYAGRVADAWCRRELLRAANDLAERVNAGDPDLSAGDLAETAMTKLRAIGAPVSGGLVTRRFSDIKRVPLQWLWQDRFPLGKPSILGGYGELGKSYVSLDMAARISRGIPWPDRPNEPQPVGDTLILTSEDDPEDTIGHRLDACGADSSRVHNIDGVYRPSEPTELAVVNFEQDLRHLAKTLRDIPTARLIIVDPLPAFLAGSNKTDTHRDSDVRRILTGVATLAAEHRVCFLGIMHTTKALQPGVQIAVHRVLGSAAFVNAARAVWMLRADPADPDHKRQMLRGKCNLTVTKTPGLAFGWDHNGAIAWDPEPVDLSANDAMRAEMPRQQAMPVDLVVTWLTELLADGPLSVGVCDAKADERGFTERTVRRARKRLGVIWSRKSDTWSLPNTKTELDE